MNDNNLFGEIKQVPIDKQSDIFKLINNNEDYLPVKLMLKCLVHNRIITKCSQKV